MSVPKFSDNLEKENELLRLALEMAYGQVQEFHNRLNAIKMSGAGRFTRFDMYGAWIGGRLQAEFHPKDPSRLHFDKWIKEQYGDE